MAETLVKKAFWKSKTMWVNFLVGVLAVGFPDVLGSVFTEVNVVMLITVVNVVLRMITKDEVGIS